MHIGTQNLLSREQNTNVSQFKTFLDKFDKLILRFKKENWKLFFLANHRVTTYRMLASDLLKKYFSIYFVRINQIKVFARHTQTIYLHKQNIYHHKQKLDIFLTPGDNLHILLNQKSD